MLVTGSNTTGQHPQVGSRLIEAVNNGAKLIVVDPRRIPLVETAAVYLQPKAGTNVAWLNGLAHVIINENLYNRKFVRECTEGFEELCKIVKHYTPRYVEEITGIPASELIEAARLYAGAHRAMFFYCMGITQFTSGVDNVRACANLAMLTGNIGRPGTGVNPLRGQNNVQGACDMGALPNVLTGYQKVEDQEVRRKFEKAWRKPIPPKPGLTITEMVNSAAVGELKCLYIMGENPLVSEPNLNHVCGAFDNLDFLVVQDIFMTETAAKADVVLPTACFAEKDGTFTNTDRRVQRIRQAVHPKGKAVEDWRIISALACKMGYMMGYENPEEIMEEISLLTPSYGGINYYRLQENDYLQWPCPDSSHPGTPFLHKNSFARGRGQFHAVHYKQPWEVPDNDYPLILITGRTAFQFHTASMTGRTTITNRETPEAFVEINPIDAHRYRIRHNQMVKVSSRRGDIRCKAAISDIVTSGSVFVPFHFATAAANMLTGSFVDPVAKIPEYKSCAVKIERVER